MVIPNVQEIIADYPYWHFEMGEIFSSSLLFFDSGGCYRPPISPRGLCRGGDRSEVNKGTK